MTRPPAAGSRPERQARTRGDSVGCAAKIKLTTADAKGRTVSDELPPEVFAADPDGEPEQTANASNDEDGPEGFIEDADQSLLPDGTVTHDPDDD